VGTKASIDSDMQLLRWLALLAFSARKRMRGGMGICYADAHAQFQLERNNVKNCRNMTVCGAISPTQRKADDFAVCVDEEVHHSRMQRRAVARLYGLSAVTAPTAPLVPDVSSN
jgi:hypothetical protein